ncbi:Carbamoyl-phosphate synthase [Mycena venus]|uniref:Carbamoyl-phosphate synthase n=1 Tax=Mycena venus TaxID=2733690 RepID=A0A8H6YPV3_9AGAR|nr:Carbamoyl-phosphate synthase [Mycena venus]
MVVSVKREWTKAPKESAIPPSPSCPIQLQVANLPNSSQAETSLDEIKETVRKRLELASVSDFTLFYDADKDTDISLENDDDFDVFEVRAHSSASSVHVVVKILSPPHAPAINVAGPSTTIRSSGSVAVDGGASGISPPQKKRKVDVGPSAKSASSAAKPTSSAEKPISSVPGPKKRKSIAAPIEGASVATAHPAPDATANEPETRGDGESVKKRRKKKNVERDAAEKPPPVPSTASEVPGPQSGEGLPGEPKKKKSKKVVEKDSANPPNPSTTGDIPGPEVTEGTRSKPKTKKVAEHGPDTPLPNPPIVETSSTDKPNASGLSTSNDIPGEQVVDGAQRKSKPKKRADQVPEAAPSKPATSKKSTRNSKKDNQTEDASTADGRSNKSVKFTFPKELAAVISAQSEPEAPSRQDLPPSEKVKKSKGKKKAVENVEDVAESSEQIEPQRSSVDPVSLKEFWKSKVPAVPVPPEPQHGPDNRIEPQPTKVAKKLAGGSKSSKQPVAADNPTTLTLCPVCETSPFHLRYRCPVVLAGPGRIRKRIAELQQDDETDHSKLIQELRTLAEKSQKTNKVKDLQNVNAHSSQLRADATEGAVSDLSGTVPGHKLAAASVSHRDEDDSDGSSDSGSTPLSRKKVAPQPADFSVDAELEAIIRGPVPSRLTVDDILTDEEEDEATESVVLENDDDDINFRRRSRQFDAVASSGEEDDDDEESISADPVAESEPPSVVNTSVRADSTHSAARSEPEPLVEVANPTSSPVIDGSLHAGSRRSSLRSQTEPLGAIAARQSVDIDLTGDTAVGDAMASDDAMFGLGLDNGAENPDSVIDSPRHSARSTPIPPHPKTNARPQPSSRGRTDPVAERPYFCATRR